MRKAKAKVGIAIDTDILTNIDVIVNSSGYLGISRSEIINVILRAFFKAKVNHAEKSRELVIQNRKGLL